MAAGTLYTYPENFRAYKIQIAAQYSGANIRVVSEAPDFKFGETNKTDDFLRKFPLGKVPAFESKCGLNLFESNAIAHFVSNAALRGESAGASAQVQQWVSVADGEIQPASCTWVYPCMGVLQYNKQSTEQAKEAVKKVLSLLNKHLETRTFLVGERVSLADISVGCNLLSLYKMVLDPEFRKPFPNVNRWFLTFVNQGESRCPIVDTWWQTETAMHMITPLPTKGWDLKPGSASMPFFGIQPCLLTPEGAEVEGSPAEGLLAIKAPWPSALRGVWGDKKRFEETYFPYPGYYLTGDGARRDEDGYYWITGRVDDVVIVSGHNIGTAEVESAVVLHPSVAEAAAVGVDHPVKGQALYVFVWLVEGAVGSPELDKELKILVRSKVGAFAAPDTLHYTLPSGLPKTRSGKIMRRILRKVASLGKSVSPSDLGDTSTLADPSVVDDLIASHADNR